MKVKNAVLVALNIRSWDPNTLDKTASSEVAQQKGAVSGSCRVRKSLLPKGQLPVANLGQIISEARRYHYAHTHAYMFEGARILTQKAYRAYREKMDGLKMDFDIAVENLIYCFNDLKGQAKTQLGALYREEDYPTEKELRDSYSFSTPLQPMPSVDAVVDLGLSADEEAALKAELASQLEATMLQAEQASAHELEVLLKVLYVRLDDQGVKIRPDFFLKIKTTAERLTTTAVLDGVVQEVSSSVFGALSPVTPVVLNTDLHMRQLVKEKIRTALNRLQAAGEPEAPAMDIDAILDSSPKAPAESEFDEESVAFAA